MCYFSSLLNCWKQNIIYFLSFDILFSRSVCVAHHQWCSNIFSDVHEHTFCTIFYTSINFKNKQECATVFEIFGFLPIYTSLEKKCDQKHCESLCSKEPIKKDWVASVFFYKNKHTLGSLLRSNKDNVCKSNTCYLWYPLFECLLPYQFPYYRV